MEMSLAQIIGLLPRICILATVFALGLNATREDVADLVSPISDQYESPFAFTGTIYVETALDQAGQSLEGGKAYRLRVPANVPAKDFWSAIAYSVNTRTFVEGKPAISSNDTAVKKNADGTVDIWFGPKPRSGEEANSIVTKPSENYFVMFRFYGAEDPIRDKTWKLADVEPVK